VSLAVEIWRALEAWNPDLHPRGPMGRFVSRGGGGGGKGKAGDSLADAVQGTAAAGPKRPMAGRSMSVADAVRKAARTSDRTGRPTQRSDGEHRAHGAHDVADEVEQALAEAGVPEHVRAAVAARTRARADTHGPRPDSLPHRPVPAPASLDSGHGRTLSGMALLSDDPAIRAAGMTHYEDTARRKTALPTPVEEPDLPDDDGTPSIPRSQSVDMNPWATIADQRQADDPLAAARTARNDAMQALAGELRKATSRADARAALTALKVSELRKLADHLKVYPGSKATKAKILDAIVDNTTGRRLDSKALGR
jgi:hypothetical protein